MSRKWCAAVLALTCSLVGACGTTAESPFKQAAMRPDRSICPVRVENGTSVPLALRYWITGGLRGPVGDALPGESVTFGVTCDTDRVVAFGRGPIQRGRPTHFRKVVAVDRRESQETVIKLTLGDQVR